MAVDHTAYCFLSSDHLNETYFHSETKSDQVSIYQSLYLLMHHTDKDMFHQYLESFVDAWIPKEPSFIQYFKTFYASRPGKYMHLV